MKRRNAGSRGMMTLYTGGHAFMVRLGMVSSADFAYA